MEPEFAPPVAPLAQPVTTTHRIISYTYDSLYRLVTATYSSGEYYHYTYDAVGNRLSLTTTVGVVNYQYDAANRLTSVNGQAYTWDNNGNLLSDGVRSYTYDHANRLTQVVSGTLTTQFVYNGAGDRVARTVDGVTTGYMLDAAAGLTQVLQETTGGQVTSYLYGHDLLAQYDSPTGQVVASYRFSPFGVPLGESGGEPYGYTGEQWDASTGLVYLRARHYQPEVGRFISKDPFPGYVDAPQTLNRWAYVTNNPILNVDPTGLTRITTGDSVLEIVDQIIRDAPNGTEALIQLFENELLPQCRPGKTTAQARLEFILAVTNMLLPGGIDAGLHFAIEFQQCGERPGAGLRYEFRDDWMYPAYWDQPASASNQIGHFLTAVRLGYDPSFLEPLLTAAKATIETGALIGELRGGPTGPIGPIGKDVVRHVTHLDEPLDIIAIRFMIGHEKKGDPHPTDFLSRWPDVKKAADGIRTGVNVPFQYWEATREDVGYFELAVTADRAGEIRKRDDYLALILGSMTDAELREREGNSMADLRLSVKGWRLGRAVAGRDQPAEKQLITRHEVADWLRSNIAAGPYLPIYLKPWK
jgi:RHS repeat-associated protein